MPRRRRSSLWSRLPAWMRARTARLGRRVFVAAGAVVTSLALLVALGAPGWIVLNGERALLAARLATLVGRAVHLEGDIRLAFLPRPHLRLAQLRVDNLSGGRRGAMLQAARADVTLALRPLLRGEWQMLGVRLVGADIILERTASGANWRGLVRQAAQSGLRFIALDDAHVTLHELVPGGAMRLGAVSITWRRGARGHVWRGKARLGDWPLKIDASLTPPADGRARLAIELRQQGGAFRGALRGQVQTAAGAPAVLTGELALRGAPLSPHVLHPFGLAVADGGARASLRGIVRASAGRVSFENFVLNDPIGRVFVALHVSRTQSQPRQPPWRLDARVRMGELDAERLRVRPARTPTASDSLVAALGARALSVLQGRASVRAERLLLGGEALDLDAVLDFAPQRLSLQEVNLSLPHGGALAASGVFTTELKTPRFEGEVSLRAHRSRALVRWLVQAVGGAVPPSGAPPRGLPPRGAPPRGLPPQALDLRSAVRATARGLWLEGLRAEWGGARHEGRVHILRGDTVRSDVVLQSQSLALEQWGVDAAALSAVSAAGAVGAGASPLARADLVRRQLTALAGWAMRPRHELRLDWRAPQIAAGRLAGERFHLALLGRDRELAIVNLEVAGVAGVSVQLRGQLRRGGARGSARLGGWLDVEAESRDASALWQRLGWTGFARQASAQGLDLSLRWRAPLNLGGVRGARRAGSQLTGQGRVLATNLAFELASPAARFLPLPPAAELVLNASGGGAVWLAALGLAHEGYAPADGRLGIKLTMQANRNLYAEVQARLPDWRGTFSGHLRGALTSPQLDGSLVLAGENAARLVPPRLARVRALASAPFAASLQLARTDIGLSFSQLELQLAESRLAGEGVVRLDTAPPLLVATLHFPRLVLARPRAADLDWSALAALNATIEWSAARLEWERVTASNLRGRLRLQDSVLEMQPLTLEAYGGTLQAALRAEGGALLPSFAVNGRWDNVALEQIAPLVYATPFVRARADLEFGLKSHGRIWRAHLANLTGEGEFRLRDGHLLGMNFAALAGEADGLQDLDSAAALLQTVLGDGESAFTTWRGAYAWRDGVLQFSDAALILRDNLGEGAMELRYDALADRLESVLAVSLASQARAAAWPAVELRLEGALLAPRLEVASDALADALAQQVLRNDAPGGLGLPPVLP